ncbi:MAG: hypothetical protein M3475_09610 [Actinomycetota bacterium]|nr:hypothetical protein [Actinomycetota bacterium]
MEENRRAAKRDPEYTVIGVIPDGVELNRAVTEIRGLGVGNDDLTVILKRRDMAEPEPFPEGTRYITVPDDRRGLEVPIGFAISFVLLGIFFAIIVPSIGIPTFMVFISLAAILIAGSFTRVGVSPILTEMEAPREEAGTWNEAFEFGKVLVFASTHERALLRPIRESLQRNDAMYYIVDQRLEPRAVHQAILHRARRNEDGENGNPRERQQPEAKTSEASKEN